MRDSYLSTSKAQQTALKAATDWFNIAFLLLTLGYLFTTLTIKTESKHLLPGLPMDSSPEPIAPG